MQKAREGKDDFGYNASSDTYGARIAMGVRFQAQTICACEREEKKPRGAEMRFGAFRFCPRRRSWPWSRHGPATSLHTAGL